MFDKKQYELLDFGDGKKLERIAGVDVVRDCPAARLKRPKQPMIESNGCGLSFSKLDKQWRNLDCVPEPWLLKFGNIKFNLRPTPFGHLGVFCEQAQNWHWILNLPDDLTGLNAINLFAYTGGTTLAMASRGVNVVHVDAAKPVVNWARENAKSSSLEDASVRWIVDDAIKFVQREIRRGNRYDIIVADPPAIGHAGKKMTWKFDRDVENLFHLLGELLADHPKAVLMTCHTDGFDSSDLMSLSKNYFDTSQCGRSENGTMDLICHDGRKLNCGHFFRWNNC